MRKTFTQFSIYFALLVLLVSFNPNKVIATSRISVSSGNYTNPQTWSPAGVPLQGDQVSISTSHNVTVDNDAFAGSVTINTGGKLTWTFSKKLTIQSNFIVNGTAEIIEGNIEILSQGSIFRIGATGIVTWQPSDNTANGASLFLKGTEDFNASSTLIINRWYNYSSVAIGSVVTGNFGNLSISTINNGLLYEWNQNNEFENHKILGTLTIGQAWVVLDKSGTISNTTIGNIVLENVNSYLDLHSGNHPGSFTLNTNSFTNIGGTFNGLYNGEGNVNIHVNGDMTNLGSTELIYNSGIQGIGNGNASLTVTGKFKQSAGDFRGIFNISSSNAGKADFEFDSVELTGGIFMGQYACHTAGAISTIKINGNLTLDYINANAKFRGSGLTSLSGVNCNLQLNIQIFGDLVIKGNPSAEFTSSGSLGKEWFEVKGETRFEGGSVNFNYGTHNTLLTFNKSVTNVGANTFFSRTSGMLSVEIKNNLLLQSGTLSVKASTGTSNITVLGNYNQSSGSLYLHNNITESTWNINYLMVYGNYSQTGGSVIFDNNSSSAAAPVISLNGNKFNLGGNATITSSVSMFNPIYGNIYFDRFGTMEYSENSSNCLIQNIKQTVSSGCNVKIINGNMQASAITVPAKDMINVAQGGILDLGSHQVYMSSQNLYSGISVYNGGRLRISNTEGLYNGTTSAAIRATGNMSYQLFNGSIVEYYGPSQQVITGTGIGTAQGIDQQYGILEINKKDSRAILQASNVTIKTGLNLTDGELTLDNYNLTLLSGIPSALIKNAGYIKSESGSNKGMVTWKNIEDGNHIIPFGITSDNLIPVSFTPISGQGNTFSAGTRSCGIDNRPLPQGITNINVNGNDAASDKVIDRWFQLNATGMKCNISLSYLGIENTTDPESATKNFSGMVWTNGSWNIVGGEGTGSTTLPGKVDLSNVENWGSWLIISNEKQQVADLLSFNAKLNHNQVDLTWITIQNSDTKKYIIQRSEDGFNFKDYIEKPSMLPILTGQTYREIDPQPITGISWYRLKQQNNNDSFKYSESDKIEYNKGKSDEIEILSVNPNPFTTGFLVKFEMPSDSKADIILTSSNGKIVYAEKINVYNGINSFEIRNIESITPGLYILSITDGKNVKNYKLFKI